MKTCDECQARLSAFLDGEAGDQEEAIRAHVRACGACRKVLDGLRHVSGLVRDVDEAPPMLVENIRTRVRKEGPCRRRWTPVPKLAAATALLAALLWAAVLGETADDDAIRLSSLVPNGDLSETERRILYDEPPTDDELLVSILSGGSTR